MDNQGCMIGGVMAVALVLIMGVGAVSYVWVSERSVAVESVEAAPVVIGKKSTESPEIARLQKRVAELEKELAEARAPKGEGVAGPPAAKGKKGGKGKGGMMKTFAKMMEDPGMKEVMRQQQGIAMKGMYADFFRELGLSEDDEAAVLELLVDKQMVNTELGMKMMGGKLSDEEKLALGKEVKESSEAIDAEIKGVLGEESFESYKLFVDSTQERQQLNTFKERLKGDGLELSVAAEEQLMDAMYSTRKNFKFTTDFGSDANPNPEALAGFNQERADRMIAELRQMNAQVAEKASRILEPAELEAFKASQESQLKMQEMGMRMGLQMAE